MSVDNGARGKALEAALKQPSLYLGQVATNGRMPAGLGAGNTTQLCTTRHVARDDISALQLGFYGTLCGGGANGADSSFPGSVTYSVTVEYPIGTTPQRVRFSGATTGTVTPGGLLISDFLSIIIPNGASFLVHNYQTGASGTAYSGVPTGPGEGLAYGNGTITDTTSTIGGGTGGGTKGAGVISGPTLLLGMTRKPSVLLLGDSRACGVGDTGDYSTNIGNLARVIGSSCGCINLGASGSTAQYTAIPSNSAVRRSVAQYTSHVAIAIGINDVVTRSAAQVAADLATIAGLLATSFPGKLIYGATVEPRTTSSDSWATTANQTLDSSNGARITLNETIRGSGIAGYAGYFDLAAAVESYLNSGLWKPGQPGGSGTSYPLTADGLHASKVGYQTIERGGVINLAALRR